MDFINYKVGDTVCFNGGYYNYKSKKRIFAKGFVTESFIRESRSLYSGGWNYFNNKEKCKTNFSVVVASGTKRFNKSELHCCEMLLIEIKNDFKNNNKIKIFEKNQKNLLPNRL